MQSEAALSFQRSRAFEAVVLDRKGEGGEENIEVAPIPNVQTVVSYADRDLLLSGWALGEETYIRNKAAMVNVPQGQGNIVLFGFRPQFRGQSGGTYKLLFNAIHTATMKEQPFLSGEQSALPRPDNE